MKDSYYAFMILFDGKKKSVCVDNNFYKKPVFFALTIGVQY